MAISKASTGLQNAEVNTLSKALCELYKANGAVSTDAAHSRLSAGFAPAKHPCFVQSDARKAGKLGFSHNLRHGLQENLIFHPNLMREKHETSAHPLPFWAGS